MRLNTQRLRAEIERAELERAEANDSEKAILARVGARLGEPTPPRRTLRPWIAGVAVSGLLVTLGIYFGTSAPEDTEVLAHMVGSESSIVGRWVKTGEETRQVVFADGSDLALFPNTAIKVEAASPSQTRVRLGDGRTHVHVIHNKSTDYRFQAGPYEIRVTGTKFELAWQTSSNHLELALLEGGVVVTGPNLDGPRRVGPGEFLQLDPRARAANKSAANPKDAGNSEADAQAEPGDAASVEPGEARAGEALVPEKTLPRTTEKSASWQALLGAGERKQAVRVAEAQGAARLLTDGSTSSLLSLAQAARLEGSPRLAEELLIALRKTRGARGQTAFYLGKIAHDQLGQKAEAKKWFETYVREAPDGTFAEQAWARLFELSGSSEQGRIWAREYLERRPSGASSARARSLLHSP